MLLSPILLADGGGHDRGLNAVGIFGAPALAPNIYNLAIIVCAVALTPFMGIYALAAGVVWARPATWPSRPTPFAGTGSTRPVLGHPRSRSAERR